MNNGNGRTRSEPRLFTLEEANRTLPLVRRILADIVEAYPALRERVQRMQVQTASGARSPEDRERLRMLRREIEAESRRIEGYIEELAQIGCEFKGYDPGLVDFPAQYGDRPILLCWRLGEPSVEYWHDPLSGYAGRQPITPDMVRALGG